MRNAIRQVKTILDDNEIVGRFGRAVVGLGILIAAAVATGVALPFILLYKSIDILGRLFNV